MRDGERVEDIFDRPVVVVVCFHNRKSKSKSIFFEANFRSNFRPHFSPHTHKKARSLRDMSVQLDPTSCSKIFSHVFKHPHSDVSGLLLTSSSSVEDKDATNVLDAIPLFHRESIDCAAMNEIALAHAHTYATSKNARICGLYFANGGNFGSREEEEEEKLMLLPESRAKGLADAIAHNTTHEDEAPCCVYVLFVDAGKLKAFVEESSRSSSTTLLPFRVFSRESNNENTTTTKSGGGSELKARSDIPARVCVPDADERQRRHWFDRDVADFDDHFDDVSKDWRNITTTT